MGFKKITDGIYIMDIPYQDGFTRVFALENNGRWIIADFAACDADGEQYIIPAVEQMGFVPEYLLCTHNHEDHSGGINIIAKKYHDAFVVAFSGEFCAEYENAQCINENDILLERYKIISLGGHTDDSIGILDMKNNILLTADALQGEGIESYGPNIDNMEKYIDTINKIADILPDGIIMSHEYAPLGGTIFGADEVKRYLNICINSAEKIISAARENPGFSPQQIADIYNREEGIRKIGDWTVESAVRYLNNRK